ncbi:mechanosensitive ion channel family protein [Alienimonas californiensis]|uniref:Small-conductance mechanosensitive channel n=1 Tax=Alienimonas californiensis TaxID=2527989 RepID=A0A517P7M7_9PLAN|nr:mechanosensitive ion channel domain-containing protein [Alienimonas californiensis]QDT15377.1 Small-conductance mechanosensitive channel [Alienimonas californiensis]
MLLQMDADRAENVPDQTPVKAAEGARDPLSAGEQMWNEFRADLWEFLPWLAAGVGIFLAFWLLAVILRGVTSRLATSRGVDRSLGRLLAKGVYITLIVTGLIVGLETAGIDMTAAIAGLGLTGFALGFALKDIVSNLIAGVLIILYKPFDEGDTVKCGGFEGVVKRIDLRYTFLENEGDDIFLPNSKLFTDPIVVKGGTSSPDMRPEMAAENPPPPPA